MYYWTTHRSQLLTVANLLCGRTRERASLIMEKQKGMRMMLMRP